MINFPVCVCVCVCVCEGEVSLTKSAGQRFLIEENSHDSVFFRDLERGRKNEIHKRYVHGLDHERCVASEAIIPWLASSSAACGTSPSPSQLQISPAKLVCSHKKLMITRQTEPFQLTCTDGHVVSHFFQGEIRAEFEAVARSPCHSLVTLAGSTTCHRAHTCTCEVFHRMERR